MAVQPLSPATDRRFGEPLPHQQSNQTRAHLQAIKSLAIEGCPPFALCGISSRFRLLSPSRRQITHVLLTRPPLTLREQAPLKSVRLACVRRAASVRPEPGSNSLIVCIIFRFSAQLLSLLSAFRNFRLYFSYYPHTKSLTYFS